MAGEVGGRKSGRRSVFLESMSECEDVGEKVMFRTIADKFQSLKEVTTAIQNVGLKECGLIFGIDYTLSNRMQGKDTYDGLSLHDVQPSRTNPYQEYHILVIVADGQVTDEKENIQAIVEASEFPLSIVTRSGFVDKAGSESIDQAGAENIGVGDGPWDMMNDFDDKISERKFDNFQFVDFNKVKQGARNPQAAVALAALMEIPDQYKYIKDLGLLDKIV
ncbi:CPNA2-like protein [Mya arenaria]|uniref:CPNA2-like protein n=1 Tax=Mya arenaria TaxID=6604 RepID=A0ABY7F7G2_MYAAR|nr:CPNA2-like protein [Mya arenaria]